MVCERVVGGSTVWFWVLGPPLPETPNPVLWFRALALALPLRLGCWPGVAKLQDHDPLLCDSAWA